MFARFRIGTDDEINVNVTLVRDFEPNGPDGKQTKINFLGGDSRIVPFSNQSVRHAFKKAVELAHAGTSEGGQPVG